MLRYNSSFKSASLAGGGVLKKIRMLLINECRTCNADKRTCPVAVGLRKNLESAGIKDRLRYKCKDWQKHLKYKVGDKITFHFIEKAHYGSELSGETLTGTIVDISKKRPVYFAIIDKENRNKIDEEYSSYHRYAMPYSLTGEYVSMEDAEYFQVPVREDLITCLAE
jgi:hypothetical protein